MEGHYTKGPGEVVTTKSSGTFHLIKILIAKRRTVKTSLSTLASATTHFRAMIAASTSHITSHHPA